MNRSSIGPQRPRFARTLVPRVLMTASLLVAVVIPVVIAGPADAVLAVPARAPACVAGTPVSKSSVVHDTTQVSAATLAQVQQAILSENAALHARSLRTGATALPAQIHIPVQIHIIHGQHRGDRRISRAAARQLFVILVRGFGGVQDPTMTPTGIIFELKKVTVSRNDRWFHATPGSRADLQMKRTLHRGTRQMLNLYLNDAESNDGALLGYSHFPWQAGAHPYQDGVTINVKAMPGGSARGYNLGDTVIHETGHWLGLLHTFEHGCSAPGDYVNDTPAEGEPSYQCDLKRDTCPTDLPPGWVTGDPVPAPVADPVQNFMDYSYDACMNHFTPDQRTRAVTLFLHYRSGH